MNTYQEVISPAAQSLAPSISKREIEILHLISLGLTDQEIGRKVYLSHYTVGDHRRNIQQKLNSRNAASSVRLGYELGYLPLRQTA